uniref:Retrovirus-related Pol polyprotein from transposon TNT 1-94 n=1 Tax=Tanacetum cinerariifolium TaxID=118510 RepID=A0A6L2LG21_TANCI|nr:hypothetical protein [Tanacetum cinerariifolium]
MCDVPFHDNSPPLDVSKDQFEDFSDSNEEFSSTDDDSFSIDKIDDVEASPPDSELVGSEVMEIVIPEVGGIDDDILLTIKDDILRTPPTLTPFRESNFFLEEVDAFLVVEDEPTSSQFPQSYLDPKGDILLLEVFLNDDHSSDFKTKSSSTFLNSLLEETNTFDNSLPESDIICFDVEEISSGSTTTRYDISFPEYEASYDDQSFSDEDVLEKIFLKPLFEEEIIPMKIDPHPDNVESDLMESLRTHDSSLIISSKIDSLFNEFADELALLKSIPPGIDETDCDPAEDIRLTERLLYDNSSPRYDSLMEEIDLSFTLDYPMPSGIEDDDYDSKKDILILKDLPSNDTLSIPEIESFHFDIPSFSRPPAKPPDGNTKILNIKMMGDISDQKAFMHKLMITIASHQEKSPDLLSHLGLKAFQPSATCPMMIHGKNNPILDVLLEMPYASPNNLGLDELGVFVNETQFRGMIGSLMYLTASIPYIQFSTYLCAMYQANPKDSHLVAVKRIFRGCQILGGKLVCWNAKKQSSVAMSSAEVEYVTAARCCAQVLWTRSQLADYDVLYDKVPIFCDNTTAIAISSNLVLHSRTKHIDIREFWYSIEVDATNPITFTLSNFDKPLSFKLGNFSSITSLKYSENYISIPPKETTLIFSSKKVNADNTIDKSLSGTTVQPVGQPKASTKKRPKKTKNPSSSEPKTKKIFKESQSKKQVTKTRHAKESVAIADATKSLEAFGSVEELIEAALDDPLAIDSRIKSMGNVSFNKLFKDQNENAKAEESPCDTGLRLSSSEKSSRAGQEIEEVDSNLESTPDDEIVSVSWNDDDDNDDEDSEEPSVADEIAADNIAEKIDFSVSQMIRDYLDKQMPDLLSDTLNSILPLLLNDSVKKLMPKFNKRVKKTLKAEVSNVVLKPLNKEFNAQNKLESRRFVTLEKKLGKDIHKKVGKSILRNVKRQIGVVNDVFKQCAKHQMQLINYIEKMLHSTVKVPRDILVANAHNLQTKVVLDYPILSPTPLNTVGPITFENIPFEQFTANLFSSSSSKFSTIPPSNMANKGKGIT